ncbi:MAG: glycosyltransferase [Actinobacteria bacterium]|nr:glycosyltransferase [Actinomycetota bacterium]
MIQRVAYLSVHTCPLARPGSGDAGGMNVYVDGLARIMAARGVQVEVFTRQADPDGVGVVEVADGYRVVHIDLPPPGDPYATVNRFVEGVLDWSGAAGARYDVVHSHYWLSGWPGLVLGDRLGVPFAVSFHTLGRVKNLNRRHDDPPASLLRIATEEDVIARAGCVVASTPAEAAELLEHYRADPERLCMSPPGVDHRLFHPGDRRTARASLGIAGTGPLVLFAGRVQPLKGLDVAVEAFARVAASHPDALMLVVGGASGERGPAEVAAMLDLVAERGLAERVRFSPPMPHDHLPAAYRAADVVVAPSRSESFGLVAAEAQACGVPVVASRVGGLAHIVEDGATGFLVDGWDPAGYAAAIGRILADPALAASMAAAAEERSARFSWSATADRFLSLYEGMAAGAR